MCLLVCVSSFMKRCMLACLSVQFYVTTFVCLSVCRVLWDDVCHLLCVRAGLDAALLLLLEGRAASAAVDRSCHLSR
jgi:hypothetical protein